MANVTTGNLPSATSVSTSDTLVITQAGVTKQAGISLLPSSSGGGGGSASNVTIDATQAPYNADKTGNTDARTAINNAINAAYALGGGEVLLPAGTYLVKIISPQPNGNAANKEIVLKPGVTIRGVRGATLLRVDADTAGQFGYLTRMVTNSGFRNVNMIRQSAFSMVFFGSEGGADNFILDGCRIDGQMDLYGGSLFAHGFQLGNGPVNNLRILNNIMRKLSYPLFQANASTSPTNTIRVNENIFELNYATDLEFNAPHSVMTDVEVGNNTFQNSAAPSDGGWFAVGYSNVQDFRVHHNRMVNYNGEAIHVEDGASGGRIDHNYLKNCAKIGNFCYIKIFAYSRNIDVDHNYIDADADTTSPQFIISVQIGGSGTTEAGNPFIGAQYVRIDSNQIYAGKASALYIESSYKIHVTNNRISSRGSYNTGTGAWTWVQSGGAVIAGVTNFGIKLYSGDSHVVTGNAIEGFFYGLAPSDNGVETGGQGWLFSDNGFVNCKYALPVIDPSRGRVGGNVISRCQHSIVAGQGAGSAKAVSFGGNAAFDCFYPVEINKSIQVSTGAVNTGSGVSVPIEATLISIPNGTVFTWAGGGSLTLTAAASRGASTLTGNLTGANIASGAAGTATTIPYSTTAAENHPTGVASITDSAGNQWPA